MKWKDFDFTDFVAKGLPKMGLTTSDITEDAATEYDFSYEMKGEPVTRKAKTCINFIPTERNIVIAVVWKCSTMTILSREQMSKEEEVFTIVVAKGAAVHNVEIGDIVDTSVNIPKKPIKINENEISIHKQISKYTLGAKDLKEVYSVEYFILPSHAVEGIYLTDSDK